MRAAAALDTATVPALPTDGSVTGAMLGQAVYAAGGAAMLYIGGGIARPYTGRIAVLTDGGTGSAAEAVAAMLQEARGAVVVGERTAGAMLSSADVMVAPGVAAPLSRDGLSHRRRPPRGRRRRGARRPRARRRPRRAAPRGRRSPARTPALIQSA